MFNDPLDKRFTAALDAWRLQYEAGIILPRALEAAAEVARDTGRQVMRRAAAQVQASSDMEVALDELSPMLSYPDRAMLAAGWQGGRLEHVLRMVTDRRRRLFECRKEMRSALMLPALVFLAACFIPPFPAWVMSGDSRAYLRAAFTPLVVAAVLVVAWTALSLRRQRRWGRRPIDAPPPTMFDDYLWLSLPIARGMEHWRNRSAFAGIMSASLSSGLMLVESLRLAARAVPNGVYRRAIEQSANDILKGEPLGTSMARSGFWPHDWVSITNVGETSGKLDETFARLADQSYERYMSAIREFSRWFPRLVYALVAMLMIYQILTLASRIWGQAGALIGS